MNPAHAAKLAEKKSKHFRRVAEAEDAFRNARDLALRDLVTSLLVKYAQKSAIIVSGEAMTGSDVLKAGPMSWQAWGFIEWVCLDEYLSALTAIELSTLRATEKAFGIKLTNLSETLREHWRNPNMR